MTGSTLKLASRLFANGIRFQYLKRTGRPGRPQAVSLEITHHCIAKCIMCNIWRIPHEVPELDTEDWLHLLSSDLFSDLRELDVTGGEPFLKIDLVEFFRGICDLKRNNFRSLQSVAITTNAFLTRRVLGYTEEILKMLSNNHIDLVVVCAMDAIGELHEKIRNYKGAWSKANKTIQGLKGLREKYPNLVVGLKTTILPLNVRELTAIAEYADCNDLFSIISPCIITDARYLNPDRAKDLVFRDEDIEKMIAFFQTGKFRWSYHRDTLAKYLRTGTMKKPCSCGFNYFFIRSTGELFLCPLIDLGFGNIKDRPVKELFFSKKASQFRLKVGSFPECRRCTEPGLERYGLPYDGFTYLALLLKMGKEKFMQLHRHMGLDKYFS